MKLKVREPYFSNSFKIFSFLAFLLGIWISSFYGYDYRILCSGMLLPIVAFSTYHLNEIDMKNKLLKEVFVFLGFWLRRKEYAFGQLERVYVASETTSQRVVTRTRDYTHRYTISTAYLIYDGQERFALYSVSSREKAYQKLTKYNQLLKLPVTK